jgi:hypothetical protein
MKQFITIDHTTMVNLDADGKTKAHGKKMIEFVKIDCISVAFKEKKHKKMILYF